ncbi:CHC2 zinc finger domain-containing protein [Marinifilum fragile]|uniref:CHC2 zinc finger domain-containing protein n=1 Tax=Marinifilum fragile TaxID=570161 RepID=UPI002AA7A997|nr:CHC2 zinc finger domain-containing protein [Marinifilum fragile]
MLKCPFHEDDNPSLKIYANTNTFNCFGCGANGDVIEFIQKKEQCSKHEALKKATNLCAGNAEIKNSEEKAKYPVASNDKQHQVILSKIYTTFKNGLNNGKASKPKQYLESRGLDFTKLEVGYNSGQFHHRGRLNDADMNDCIDAGLLIPYNGSVPNAKGTTYTAFAKDCVIFPLKNRKGEIVSIYGRNITETGKHYYLKDRQGLYPGCPKQEATKLILTEAIIDAATLIQLQIENMEVLSCFGTNGLTDEHRQAIKELPNLEEIIFFFDGDKAGNEAIEKYGNELRELLSEVEISKVNTPEGEDINSLYVSYDKDAILQLLEERNSFLLPEEPVQTQGIASPKEKSIAKLNTNNPDFITYTTDELQIIILGGINLQQLDRLRITLKISRKGMDNPLHSIRHTLDLYHSDYLEKFRTTVLKRTLAELTDGIEKYRLSRIESQKEKRPQERKLTDSQIKKAIKYLSSKKLMERTNEDIGKTGMIGEENNRLLMYLVFTSRLREQPLHIISLGASGTGKTYLQEKISELIPEHHKLEITMLSENAFYYFGQQELKNKLVLIEDMDGAEHVLYPLRELQSKKRISKTIPIKDSKGNLKTITMKVEGPICLAGTTTKEKLYEDNANRSLLIYLDSSKHHKEQIMNYQRKLSAGKIATKHEHQLIEFFKDMQTVLKPIKVRNPYAEYLVIPEHVFKPLRTNSHYLAFIETITFYHQYQREVKNDPVTNESYIETTLEDIEWANKLLKDVLLAKADELPKAERQFFESLKSWMQTAKKGSFFSKEVRDVFRMHPSKIKRYLNDLLRYNFIKVVGGNRYKGGLEYEVINTQEYKELESGITTALDDVLKELTNKLSGSVVHQWSKMQNRPLNGKENSKLNAVAQ